MARVLIVDDERKLRRAFVLFLREDDHDIESAANLDEALAALERGIEAGQPFDVVVTDTLPEDAGLSLMRTVGERWPELELILATDERGLESAISAVRGGAHSYLSKPVTATMLRRAVAAAASSKAEREAEQARIEAKERECEALTNLLDSQGLEFEELCMELAEFGIDRAPPSLPKLEPEPMSEPPKANRILVVDDERTLRRVFSMFLGDDGFEVETADNVNEGIAAIEKNNADGTPFGIVVSDICMPGRDGTALMKEVAERWPEIKMIVVTGEPTVETATLAVQTRAYEYMYKPVSSWLIRKVVANALVAKAAEDEQRREVAALDHRLAYLGQHVEARKLEMVEIREQLAAAAAAEH